MGIAGLFVYWTHEHKPAQSQARLLLDTMANDPLAVIHIHDDGGATLMGTDYRLTPEGVADMVRQGERFFWIEPPQA